MAGDVLNTPSILGTLPICNNNFLIMTPSTIVADPCTLVAGQQKRLINLGFWDPGGLETLSQINEKCGEAALAKFINYYNNERLHESLENITPADMYYGRKEEILTQRQIIKHNTLAGRKRINLKLRHQEVSIT